MIIYIYIWESLEWCLVSHSRQPLLRVQMLTPFARSSISGSDTSRFAPPLHSCVYYWRTFYISVWTLVRVWPSHEGRKCFSSGSGRILSNFFRIGGILGSDRAWSRFLLNRKSIYSCEHLQVKIISWLILLDNLSTQCFLIFDQVKWDQIFNRICLSLSIGMFEECLRNFKIVW